MAQIIHPVTVHEMCLKPTSDVNNAITNLFRHVLALM